MADCVEDGSLNGASGEELLDRVQIGRVFWQKEQSGADQADETPDCLAMVAAEIVDHYEVVRPQRR